MKRPPKRKRRPVKPERNPEIKNIYNPEYEGLIEPAVDSHGKPFIVRGKQYYNFKSDSMVRTGRYMFVQNFLQEANYRMTVDRLKAYIARIRSEIDGSKQGKEGPTINIGNAIVFLDQMKNLTELAFEPETVYRLASVIYFDDTEDVTRWDKEHNDKKIAAWKEDGTLDFFYGRPFIELTGLKGISETDLRDCFDKFQKLTDEYNTVLNSKTQTV